MNTSDYTRLSTVIQKEFDAKGWAGVIPLLPYLSDAAEETGKMCEARAARLCWTQEVTTGGQLYLRGDLKHPEARSKMMWMFCNHLPIGWFGLNRKLYISTFCGPDKIAGLMEQVEWKAYMGNRKGYTDKLVNEDQLELLFPEIP